MTLVTKWSCYVCGFTRKSAAAKGLSFHAIPCAPTSEQARDRWLEFLHLPPSSSWTQELWKNITLCSRHFEDEMYYTKPSSLPVAANLKNRAAPTLEPPVGPGKLGTLFQSEFPQMSNEERLVGPGGLGTCPSALPLTTDGGLPSGWSVRLKEPLETATSEEGHLCTHPEVTSSDLECFDYESAGTSQEVTTNSDSEDDAVYESTDESVDSDQLLRVALSGFGNRYCNSAPRSIKRPQKQMSAINAAIKELKALTLLLTAPSLTTIVEDECVIVGKQVASQLHMLPEHLRLDANFEIQRVLRDFRMKHIRLKSTTLPGTLSIDHTYSIPSDSGNVQHHPILDVDLGTNDEVWQSL